MAKLNAYFGEFGGQFVPQILVPALDQLEQALLMPSRMMLFALNL